MFCSEVGPFRARAFSSVFHFTPVSHRQRIFFWTRTERMESQRKPGMGEQTNKHFTTGVPAFMEAVKEPAGKAFNQLRLCQWLVFSYISLCFQFLDIILNQGQSQAGFRKADVSSCSLACHWLLKQIHELHHSRHAPLGNSGDTMGVGTQLVVWEHLMVCCCHNQESLDSSVSR